MAYAINNRTKEHRVIDNDPIRISPEYNIVGADPDGWIPWHGGECPLPCGARFDAKTKDGGVHEKCRGWRWNHDDVISDIIAYRPILDDKPEPGIDITRLVTERQAPEWDGEGLPPVGCECECTFAVEDHDTWHIGVVTLRGIAPEGHEIVAINTGDYTAVYRSTKHIRPIRSEEDRAVEEMMRIYRENESVSVRDAMRDLYRAGYRRA